MEELSVHLSLLLRRKVIEVWSDAEIRPGREWNVEIKEQLERAEIILMLVSADYMASDFLYSEELTRVLQKAEAGTATVIPIVVRPVLWSDAPFSHFQVLPSNGTPVSVWSNRDSAWASIVEAVTLAVNRVGQQAS